MRLTVLFLIFAAVVGWFMNLAALINGCIDYTPTANWAFLALRAIGVFVFPLGSGLGLFA